MFLRREVRFGLYCPHAAPHTAPSRHVLTLSHALRSPPLSLPCLSSTFSLPDREVLPAVGAPRQARGRGGPPIKTV
jgi:hypothetical protein